MRWIMRLITCSLLLAGSAQAGDFQEGSSSTLGVIVGGLPSISIDALAGTASLVSMTDGSLLGPTLGHNVLVLGTVWSTVNFGPGTTLFTGVPLVSNLKFTVNNKAGLLQDGFIVPSNQIGGGVTVGPGLGGEQTAVGHRAHSRRQLGITFAKSGKLVPKR